MEESLGVTKTQYKALVKYISDNMKVPVLGAGGGFAPLGTINAYMGTVAPQGWLICNGQTVNITDYPELATHFASQLGSANVFGGDGVTTFAMPDLRGEFLRGSGTNSHTNQGNGANVGVHQDGTEINNIITKQSTTQLQVHTSTSGSSWEQGVKNYDSQAKTGDNKFLIFNASSSGSDLTGLDYVTTRPTNTSVTYIIKATVSGNPEGHVYSTEEQIVSTDENGDAIYQRTFTGTVPSASTTGGTTRVIQTSFADKVVKSFNGVVRRSDGTTFNINTCFVNTDTTKMPNISCNIGNDGIYMKNARSNEEGASFRIVVEYTKSS